MQVVEAGLDADDARRAPVRLGAAGVGGLRLIHLSDLHATDHRHVWDYDGGLRRRRSDSAAKLDRLVTLLRLRRPELAGASVVITGDLTDRGDRAGHRLAAAFVDAVRSEGYGVHVVPGNHDWFWKGNRGADAVLERARALTAARPGARRRAPLARVARLHALTRHRYPAVGRSGGRANSLGRVRPLAVVLHYRRTASYGLNVLLGALEQELGAEPGVRLHLASGADAALAATEAARSAGCRVLVAWSFYSPEGSVK